MPLQLHFDFRFRRALKELLKQMCRTKICYYTNAKSHYPRVESDLRYSELHVPKMSPLSSAQLSKSQLQEMRDYMANKARSKCCTKSGEEHEYKGQRVRAHFGQSNFSFFQQKRKKEILLILIIFACCLLYTSPSPRD